MRSEIANEIGAAAAKASVPMSVVGASAVGWGVQEWMFAATLVYVLAQMGYLLWKWRKEWREAKAFAAKIAEPAE